LKKLIEPYKKILIVLSFPYIYMLFILTVPTQFEGVGPGGITPVSESITVEGSGALDISTIYVISYEPLTPLQSWLMRMDQDMDVYPRSDFSKTLTLRDQLDRGQLSKEISFTNALIAAYSEAMKTEDDVAIDYAFSGLRIDYRPKTRDDLRIGDRIVAIDGIAYTESTPEDFLGRAESDLMTLTVRRGDDTFEYDYDRGDDLYRLRFLADHTINEAVPAYALPGLDKLYGGPSGGAMQALYIYASLVNINTHNRQIVGTGTISSTGLIGRIGGLEQKMITAERGGADVFFVPGQHAGEVEDLERFTFDIVYVDSLVDVLNVFGGWDDETA
jgi:Lon-like protease